MYGKVQDIVRTDGMSGLARRSIAFAYRRGVRRFMPREPAYYAGIRICYDRKWGDRIVPASWVPAAAVKDQPHYEATLVAGLRDHQTWGQCCHRWWGPRGNGDGCRVKHWPLRQGRVF